ncbi:MAG: hypothetical protein AAF488_12865 [Planctomycetota bacterium]
MQRRTPPWRSAGQDLGQREEGNALLLSLLVLFLIVLTSSAQFFSKQSEFAHANSVYGRSILRQYAESALDHAILSRGFSADPRAGAHGTADWSLEFDFGIDGIPDTEDPGEGDGMPTPGEPGVLPSPVGPSTATALVAVHVEEKGGLTHLVSSVSDNQSVATVSRVVKERPVEFPKGGALVLSDGATVRGAKGRVLVDGRDHRYDRRLQKNSEAGFGVVTPSRTRTMAVRKAFGVSSVVRGRSSGLWPQSFGAIEWGGLRSADVVAAATRDVATGEEDLPRDERFFATRTSGDFRMSRSVESRGLLFVNGDLEVTGPVEFRGVLFLRGELRVARNSRLSVLGQLIVLGGVTLDGDEDRLSLEVRLCRDLCEEIAKRTPQRAISTRYYEDSSEGPGGR